MGKSTFLESVKPVLAGIGVPFDSVSSDALRGEVMAAFRKANPDAEE